MKKTVIGILAHVDSGKTTLAEGILFRSGMLRSLGRVDHKNAFLDTDEIERDRGITIFSKQAEFQLNNRTFTLLDTPGHVDFSAEAERVLSVLDYAVLVISAPEGIQSHTETLWQLLSRYHIPTFLFINKMDIALKNEQEILTELRKQLSENCFPFAEESLHSNTEDLAMCTEELMNDFLTSGLLKTTSIINAARQRKIFPCFFGSALKLIGIDNFLSGLVQYTVPSDYPDIFGAKIFKITEDSQKNRLTHLKITGGKLRVKEELSGSDKDGKWTEKVNQIRIYSGEKFRTVDTIEAGGICAITGLSHSFAGEGLGFEDSEGEPVLEPVFSYKMILPEGTDTHVALMKLKRLEEEDPQLNIIWNEFLQEIHLRLMGEIQLEVLKRVIKNRFDMEVSFDQGAITYKETISSPSFGIGHFEPLRHYAEVHVLIEPAERGSGISYESKCSEDMLERNWQRLILTHLKEKTHLGVLTGSPITDVKITLLAGRAHKKHTEGGDFRQATYRAVRNALRQAQSILLEPVYQFKLMLPQEQAGRAMTDLQNMGATFSAPDISGGLAVLTGTAPVSEIRDYMTELTAYTSGRGRLNCILAGYEPCHNTDEVVCKIGYDCNTDTENTADSVFCAHGAGFNVPWNEVRKYAQVEITYKTDEELAQEAAQRKDRAREYLSRAASDKELMEIFERTYGSITRREYAQKTIRTATSPLQKEWKPQKTKVSSKEYLLVDGYNVIFAWEELKKLAQDNLDAARGVLINTLCNYQGYTQCEVILVFDAYKVKNNPGSVEKIHNINIVYTKEAETADMYIEKVTHELTHHGKVSVVTSDSLEQLIILGGGALRISADQFYKQICDTENAIREVLQENRN